MFITTQKDLDVQLQKARGSNQKTGLVPTMGALHSGHLSLISKAYEKADVVVVSIFVNPTQFNNADDLEKYPRNTEEDLAILKKHNPNTIAFVPSVADIYAKNVSAEKFDFGPLTKSMEGEFRAGHFNGVGTIIKRLFDLIKPDYAFFGEKDFQQLMVIKKLVEITQQPVEIIGCETDREANGLAKSSRNKRLSKEETEIAQVIFDSLTYVKKHFNEMTISELKNIVESKFEQTPKIELEYFSIAPIDTLTPTNQKEAGKKYRGFIAAFINEVR
ncbi:MAG: pantoate--beta-alanine ligase, partial [Bacteroidota bacterium]